MLCITMMIGDVDDSGDDGDSDMNESSGQAECNVVAW